MGSKNENDRVVSPNSVPFHFKNTNECFFFFICRDTKISVVLPEVECEDGSKITPLKISFPEGHG